MPWLGGGVGLFWGAVVSCADGEGLSIDDLVCNDVSCCLREIR